MAARSTTERKALLLDEIHPKHDIQPVDTKTKKTLEAFCQKLLDLTIYPCLSTRPNNATKGKYLRQLAYVLMTLLRAYSIGPDIKVAIPTSTSAYAAKTVLGKKAFSARVMKDIMDSLTAAGLVIAHGNRSYADPDNSTFDTPKWKSTGSRWTATPELIDQLRNHELTAEKLKHGMARKPVHVRDSTGKDIPQGLNTAEQGKHDAGLRRINQLLWSTQVEIDCPFSDISDHYHLQPWQRDKTRSTLTRIHSGDILHCGRYFGHWVQGLPKEIRQKNLTMDGEKIVELDFKSFNISLLYALIGEVMPEEFDPYVWDDCAMPRNAVKTLLLIALNAKTKHEAITAARDDLRPVQSVGIDKHGNEIEVRGKCPHSYQLMEKVLDQALDRLPSAISEKFFTSFGTRAMWYESEIAFKTMIRMADHRVAVIPIHDGFICKAKHEDLLKQSMEESYMEVLPLAPARPAITRETD